MRPDQTLYLSSCVPDGGLYRYTLTVDGRLLLQDHYAAAEPMYAIRRGSIIYLLLLAPFPGSDESGAQALIISEEGSLIPLGEPQPLGGTVSCHLAVSPSGRFLYTANYLSGSITELPILADGRLGPASRLVRHTGSSVHPQRQTGPHPHCTVFSPDGHFLCVADLGSDEIVLYAADQANGIDPEPALVCAAAPGYGPRHLIFAADGLTAFCANELISSLTTYSYAAGSLVPQETRSTLPDAFSGTNTCAAIRLAPDGRHVYVSNRGHDSIACFSVAGPSAQLVSTISCGGASPRDFAITPDGKWLICTNERGHTATVLPLDPAEGTLQPPVTTMPLAAPLCVTYA